MAIKFKPGDVFRLTPRAKITWLTVTVYGPTDPTILALRTDTPRGQSLLAWIAKGKPANEQPARTHEFYRECREFYEDDLTKATAA